VTVYCRSHHVTYDSTSYRGMRLVKLPTIATKYLDTMAHSLLSSLHALSQNYDVALYFIAANSPVTWVPRMVGTKTVLNVDGLDWKREKWPPAAKKYIQFAEYLATKLPTACVTDSREVQCYYLDHFGTQPVFIPYGSEVHKTPPGKTLARFGLEPGRYILFVGRLVPENCVHHLVEAFQTLDTTLKCAVVGDSAYAQDYIARLKRTAQDDPRIVFTGYVFGEGYHELGSNAHMFVETSGVGGTHPALTEAMGFGNCIVAHDTPENLETIGDAGLAYAGAAGARGLSQVLRDALSSPGLVEDYRRRARRRARTHYSWEAVADAYERLFYRIREEPHPDRLAQPG